MKKSATRYLSPFFLIFHFSFFIFHFSFVYSQIPTVQDCLGAIPICQEVYTEFDSYSGSGHYPNEIYNPPGDCTQDCPGSCLDGEQNSVWYILTVQNEGILRFTLNPAANDDYDWAVYDITELDCDDIYSSYDVMQKSCNAYGYPPNGPTGISTAAGGTTDCNHCGGAGSSLWNADLFVTEGSIYVIVVENWSGTNDGFTIDFSSSSASIFDSKPPELDTVFTDGLSCGVTEITFGFSERVMCESVDPSDFIFTGPGGSYNILDVQGETCMLGGDMEQQFTLLLDRRIVSNGECSLQLVPGNDVYDACNNIAIADTIIFNPDLDAPVVIDTGIVITPANYGLNNGQITGLIVNGSGPLSYRWYDHLNDTVGTGLELHNVYSGDYYLEITDTNGCKTNAGPYFVDLVEDISETQNNYSGIISVFPNPNPGKFTLMMSENVVNISIINMIGNTLYSFDKEDLTSRTLMLDLSRNEAGLYLIKATLADRMVVTRLLQIF
jgi:hypothetical protein